MPFNFTAIGENSTTVVGHVQTLNTVLVEGLLGIILLIGISVIIFIAFSSRTGDTSRSLAGTAFITFIVALMFRAISLIPNLALFVCLIFLAGAVALAGKNQ